MQLKEKDTILFRKLIKIFPKENKNSSLNRTRMTQIQPDFHGLKIFRSLRGDLPQKAGGRRSNLLHRALNSLSLTIR